MGLERRLYLLLLLQRYSTSSLLLLFYSIGFVYLSLSRALSQSLYAYLFHSIVGKIEILCGDSWVGTEALIRDNNQKTGRIIQTLGATWFVGMLFVTQSISIAVLFEHAM